MTEPVRIPADVDRPDRLVAGLTARQLLIVAAAAALLYPIWWLTRPALPLFALCAVPVVGLAAALALGQRDGTTLDRLALAALRSWLAPRRQVCAPEGLPAPPPWAAAPAGASGDVVPLRFTCEDVADDGLVDLGADGLAIAAAASTVNLALRAPAEQEALIATFARYLHALSGSTQVLVRADDLDLTGEAGAVRAAAAGLPCPPLADAAAEHAAFLERLAAGGTLLRRQVLLVLREPLATVAPGQRRGTSAAAARARLRRRLAEAAGLLAPAGVTLTPLAAGAMTAVLARACNPAGLVPASEALAAADAVVTSPGPERTGAAAPHPATTGVPAEAAVPHPAEGLVAAPAEHAPPGPLPAPRPRPATTPRPAGQARDGWVPDVTAALRGTGRPDGWGGQLPLDFPDDEEEKRR